MFLSPQEGPTDQWQEGLSVCVDDTLGNMTLETFIEGNMANIRQTNKDFTLIESTPTTLAGVPAHQVIYLTSQHSKNQQKVLSVVTVRNNVFYWLTYQSEPVTYLKFLSSVEQMISSFEFLG